MIRLLAILLFGLGLSLAQNYPLAPDFKLMGTDGRALQLSSLRGKPVVLVFWATWCHVCEEEMPKLNALYRRNPGKFAVVAVHVDPNVSTGRIRDWVKDHSWAFPGLHDGPAQGSYSSVRQLAQTYRVLGTPTFFFIDKTGTIKGYNPGGMSESTFRQGLAMVGVDGIK